MQAEGGDAASSACTWLQLQRAVQVFYPTCSIATACRYKDATTFRDLLADLEQESKRLSALSAEWSFKAQPQLRLGQRVLHRSQGYR